MRIKTFFTKKKIIWTVVILFMLFLGFLIFSKKSNTNGIQVDVVKKQDIQKTVLTTGQVVSSTDLDLSFQSSGVVKKVSVKEGDTVKAGQVLAQEDVSDLSAQLHQAQAQLDAEKAKFASLVAGTRPEQLSLDQSAFDSAQTALMNAVQNGNVQAEDGIQNKISPFFSTNNTIQEPITLQSKYYNILPPMLSTLTTWSSELSASTPDDPEKLAQDADGYLTTLISSVDSVNSALSEQAGQTVLSLSTIQTLLAQVTAVRITLTTAKSAIDTAAAAYSSAKGTLALAKAGATQNDIDAEQALVDQAQASVDSVNAKLSNSEIVAPISGTVTQVDTKVGELAQPGVEAMKLLNVDDLHTEALVSEADIASVAVGQPIDNTFDALGPDRHFTTTVLTVNPASTVISGVVDYKVTGSLEKIPDIKPGMTANMTIDVADRKNVLVVPSTAVINKNGEQIVRVVTNPKNLTFAEVPVQTGLEADGGLTEIISGLSEGQEIVTYMK